MGLLVDHATGGGFPDLEAYKTIDYKVGDLMPDFKKGNTVVEDGGFTDRGRMVLTYKHRDSSGVMKYLSAYLTCNPEHIPFGVFEKATNRLYLDNNPTDGHIDNIIENTINRKIRGDIPECPT